MKLVLDLDFFAAVIHAPRKEVNYALLKVTEDGVTNYRPVVTVSFLKHYVYDLQTAQFIGIDDVPEVKKVLEPATARKSRRGIILKSNISGIEETYTTLDFYNTFRTVVVNDTLS
jgi:hypothetical protein